MKDTVFAVALLPCIICSAGAPDNPVRSADLPASPPMTDGYVDYQAMIKAWDREQENLHRIRMKAGKRNPSHDPVYREPSSGAEK